MTRLPDEVVGDAYTSTRARELLEELVDVGPRMAGHEGEKAGAELVREAFAEAGLREVGTEEFEIPGWWRGSSSLTAEGRTFGADHEVISLPGGPSGAVEAELVDLGHGMPAEIDEADLDGAVAMVRSDAPPGEEYVHRMVKYAAAAEAGASGFVYRNHVEGCLPPTGDVGYHDRPGPIPAVGVSGEVGARLARYCEDSTVEVELAVDCRHGPATSVNTHGTVGPDTAEAVLVTAHVDAHDIAEGAGDNGVGSVLVAEVGRLLARVEEKLDTRVECVVFGAEEIGLFGAYHHAEKLDREDVKCVLNVDGAGGSRDLRLSSMGFSDVADAVEAATARLDAPLRVSDDVSPHADNWAFCERGIPAVTAGSVSEGTGRGWGHTHADTLDKLDSRDLRALAIQLAEATVELADADREIAKKSKDEIEDALDENDERELKAGGRWHFG